MSPEQARATLRDADCLYSRDAVETAIDRLAERTAQVLKDRNPLVLGVMNGGVVLMGGLLTRWSFPMQVDYLHATRYRGGTRGRGAAALAGPPPDADSGADGRDRGRHP